MELMPKEILDYNGYKLAWQEGQQEEKMVSDNLARSLERLLKETGTYCLDCDVIIFDIGHHNADHSFSLTSSVAEAKKALRKYKVRITWG